MSIIRTHPEPTFRHFYLGFIIIVIGLSLFSFIIPAAMTIISGVFFLLSIQGVHIDIGKRQVKAYDNFFFIKIGKWEPLDNYSHLVLGLANNSKSVGRIPVTIRTRSYSVYLLEKTGKMLELKEFTEYRQAKQYLDEMAERLNFPTLDKQEIIMAAAAQNRPLRKR